MAVVPSLILDAWREARRAYTWNTFRADRGHDAHLIRTERSRFNAANPGFIPHTGMFNRVERSRLKTEARSATTAYDAAMVRPRQIPTDRHNEAIRFARFEKGINDQIRDVRNTIVAAIETRIQTAETNYQATVAPLWFWQILKKRQALRTRDYEIRMATLGLRRLPLMVAMFKKRRALKKQLRDGRKIYTAWDKHQVSDRKRLSRLAKTSYNSTMATVRTDRRTGRKNTQKNAIHITHKTLENFGNHIAEKGHIAAGIAAGSIAGFKAAADEIGSRTFAHMGLNPRMRAFWHRIQLAFS